jgi:phenylalanyl-tRNA synthetase beta chain
MKISLDWMKQYIDLPESPDELIDVLPMLGLEVEEDESSTPASLDKVVVGEVLTKNPHPEADRLSVCSVKVGTEEPATIVCGASNFEPGDRVPVALPGAKLPGGFKIKKSNLRGVASEGMMCSAKELDIGTDADGLMILSGNPEPGMPVDQLFSQDKTLELEITANRGDCLSYLGVAREIGAYYQKQIRIPQTSPIGTPTTKVPENFPLREVSMKSEACSLYKLWSIRGVKIGPSPSWLQARLEAVGLRPINNVVDVTNFVLLETGQPLHAFDSAKISGETIRIREAQEGESITTLDEVERQLDSSMMVIADSEKPLVVAGVMGSVDAEVDENTTDLVLESAWFHPGKVRATARKLGLHTDSSQRFSRNVDPQGLDYAAQRAIDLITETAGGSVNPDFVSLGEAPRGERTIEVHRAYVEQVCGFDIAPDSLIEAWVRLGFSVQGEDPWQVTVPSFRSEVDRPIDLVEEFLRIHGTDDLKDAAFAFPATHRENDSSYDFLQRAIDNLIGQGFQECCNYSLRSSAEISAWHPHSELKPLALKNPLTADHTHVRASLLPGLVDNLSHNQKNLTNLTQVFETGRVFRPGPRGNLELISVAFASFAKPNSRQWKNREDLDFFGLKNQLQRLLHATGLNQPRGQWDLLSCASLWQDGYSARLGDFLRNKLELSLGIIKLSLSKEKEAKGPILAAEVLIDPILLAKRRKSVSFASFSTFPPAIKDLALVVDQSEPADSVRNAIESIAQEVAKGKFEVDPVTIFDLFSGEGMETGKKSVACSMRFRATDRTLSEKELNQAFDSVVEKVTGETAYELRK